ncbi:hypothetical protein ONZ45_g267 [Pleurotus djamor]|nr:hypothetical protein ONZ45_g267 [Pleurotus djamor]
MISSLADCVMQHWGLGLHSRRVRPSTRSITMRPAFVLMALVAVVSALPAFQGIQNGVADYNPTDMELEMALQEFEDGKGKNDLLRKMIKQNRKLNKQALKLLKKGGKGKAKAAKGKGKGKGKGKKAPATAAPAAAAAAPAAAPSLRHLLTPLLPPPPHPPTPPQLRMPQLLTLMRLLLMRLPPTPRLTLPPTPLQTPLPMLVTLQLMPPLTLPMLRLMAMPQRVPSKPLTIGCGHHPRTCYKYLSTVRQTVQSL